MLDLNLKKYLVRYCGIKDIERVASVHAFGVEYYDDDDEVKFIHQRIYSFDDLEPEYNYFFREYHKIIIVFDDGGTLTMDFFPHKWERIWVNL